MESTAPGRLVHYACDEFGDIFVLDEGDHRILTFDYLHEQSCMEVARPHRLVHEHALAMMMVLAFALPRRAIHLGLGGGCLVRALHHLCPQCEQQVVELREKVCLIAADWFGLPDSAQIQFTLADAGEALALEHNGSAGLIFADLFHADANAPVQREVSFLEACHRVLAEDGWLVANYSGTLEPDAPLPQALRHLYAEVLLCPIADENSVILAAKSPLPKQLDAFLSQLLALEVEIEAELLPLFQRLIQLPANPSAAESGHRSPPESRDAPERR